MNMIEEGQQDSFQIMDILKSMKILYERILKFWIISYVKEYSVCTKYKLIYSSTQKITAKHYEILRQSTSLVGNSCKLLNTVRV